MKPVYRLIHYLAGHKKAVGLLAIAAIVLIAGLVVILRTQLPVHATHTRHNQRIDKPFSIRFNQSLGSLDSVSISPKLDGIWKEKRSLLGITEISFDPKEDFQANTTYTVTAGTIKRTVVGTAVLPKISFKTESAPGVASFSVSNYNNKPLPADHQFTVRLTSSNRNLRHLELITKPKLPLIQTTTDGTSFTWKSKKLLPQGKSIQVTLKDNKAGETLRSVKVTVAKEPSIATPVKNTNFGKDDKAVLTFSESIVPSSAKIKFNLNGKGRWRNGMTYEFTPQEVEPGKRYTYSVAAGLRSKAGGILRQEKKLSFSTPGIIAAISSSPWGSELSQASQEIRFTLNQPVDRKSAESRFHVSSGKLTGIRWEGTALVATVVNLGYQRNVSAWLDPGIQPLFGLPSSSRQSVSFTTEARIKKAGRSLL